MGEPFDVTLDMHQAEEREALRDAFISGTVVAFRGRMVSVVGQFVRRHPDLTWQVTYRLHPVTYRPHPEHDDRRNTD
jgi:hypothetical protein